MSVKKALPRSYFSAPERGARREVSAARTAVRCGVVLSIEDLRDIKPLMACYRSEIEVGGRGKSTVVNCLPEEIQPEH